MKPPIRLLLWLVALLAAPTGCAAPSPAGSPAPARERAHVVVVSVDGLRPDAIAAAGASNLARLLREGAGALDARADTPTLTLPNHLAMASGLTSSTHGVLTNQELAREFDRPTVFTAAHAAGLRTALYFGKAKLIALAPAGSADIVHGPGRGESDYRSGASAALAGDFAAEFATGRTALAWLHLREPDEAGHDHGWMSQRYLEAVRIADVALGTVLKAIDDAGLWSSTTLLLTSDHGGWGKRHWDRPEEDSLIPWICRGPHVASGTVLHGARAIDVAPTALALLGLPSLPGSEGRAVPECLPTSAR